MHAAHLLCRFSLNKSERDPDPSINPGLSGRKDKCLVNQTLQSYRLFSSCDTTNRPVYEKIIRRFFIVVSIPGCNKNNQRNETYSTGVITGRDLTNWRLFLQPAQVQLFVNAGMQFNL